MENIQDGLEPALKVGQISLFYETDVYFGTGVNQGSICWLSLANCSSSYVKSVCKISGFY